MAFSLKMSKFRQKNLKKWPRAPLKIPHFSFFRGFFVFAFCASFNKPHFYGDYLTSTPNYAVNINFQLLQNPNFNQSPGHYQQYAQQLQHQQFHQPIPQSPHPGTLTNNVSRRNFITEMADKSYVANQYRARK